VDEAIESVVATLLGLSARYPREVAPRIEDPASPAEISELQAAAGQTLPALVLALFQRTRAIVAMEVRNGYAIGGPLQLARSLRRQDFPASLDVQAPSARAIPVATDGGGNAFMVALGDGSVWRWDHETGALERVARDLPDFLGRIAEDWAHDLDGDSTWNYLV